MTDEERLDVARHLAACMDCTEEYRAIRALEPWAQELQRDLQAPGQVPVTASEAFPRQVQPSEARDSHSDAAVRKRISTSNRTRAVLAAAAMIVIAVTSLVIWQSSESRGPGQSSERSGLSFRLTVDPPNKATVPQAPAMLSWSALEKTLAYRVVLYDFQSTPIWESSRLTTTSVALPEEVRGRLSRNQTYYWRVIAEDAIEQRQSELFQFTVTASPDNRN
jgi:hypothetical protein